MCSGTLLEIQLVSNMITVRPFEMFMLLLIVLSSLSCNSRSPVQTADKIKVMDSRVSECGGFVSPEKRMDNNIPLTRDPSTYCDAEKLQWLYDENTLTLSVLNSRVLLNCCGEHDITASYENGAAIIAENDQPVNGTDRCRCMCVYDFFIEISGLSPGVITLKLDLTVDEDTRNKWEGTIDIREKNGEIIIDDKPLDNWCP